MKRTSQVPGEQKLVTGAASTQAVEDGAAEKVRSGITELNNTTGTTANQVGEQREDVVQAMAMAEAAKKGVRPDLAPRADIGKPAEPTSIKRKAIINGVAVEVEVPTVRRNSAVEQFGQESKHPRGTLVNKDGTLHEGGGEPYGVIGDINTSQGKLVNRIIPLDSVQAAA